MGTEFDNFEGGLDQQVDSAETAQTGASNSKKQAMQMYEDAMKQTLREDVNKEFIQIKGSMSAALEVVNVLSYTDSGNFVEVQKADKEKGIPRQTATMSQNVGLRILNKSDRAIPYKVEVFTSINGKLEPQIVDREIAPGAFADIPTKWATHLASKPEFSNKFANGFMKRAGKPVQVKPDMTSADILMAELEKYHFEYNKDMGLTVNDDAVKLQIGKKVKDAEGKEKWVVQDEFKEVFAYLEVGKRGLTGEKRTKFDSQDLAANYINRLAHEAGLA